MLALAAGPVLMVGSQQEATPHKRRRRVMPSPKLDLKIWQKARPSWVKGSNSNGGAN